ncbi:hypothetical protein HD554DRAFT_2040418 [Boletus coccyginus]|nr:hypothetical protein HD554DRAFT_2040418 [Boletus coccyginus]
MLDPLDTYVLSNDFLNLSEREHVTMPRCFNNNARLSGIADALQYLVIKVGRGVIKQCPTQSKSTALEARSSILIWTLGVYSADSESDLKMESSCEGKKTLEMGGDLAINDSLKLAKNLKTERSHEEMKVLIMESGWEGMKALEMERSHKEMRVLEMESGYREVKALEVGSDLGTKDDLELVKNPEMESELGMEDDFELVKDREMESSCEEVKALEMEGNLCMPFCDARGTTCRHQFHRYILSLPGEPVSGKSKGVQLSQPEIQGPDQQK